MQVLPVDGEKKVSVIFSWRMFKSRKANFSFKSKSNLYDGVIDVRVKFICFNHLSAGNKL